jgi:hypothetical protein
MTEWRIQDRPARCIEQGRDIAKPVTWQKKLDAVDTRSFVYGFLTQ